MKTHPEKGNRILLRNAENLYNFEHAMDLYRAFVEKVDSNNKYIAKVYIPTKEEEEFNFHL
jgi:hypothetical protein